MVGVAAKLPEAFPLMQQVRTAPGPWDAAIVLSHPSQQAERKAVRIYMERRGCAFLSYSQSCVCSPAVLPTPFPQTIMPVLALVTLHSSEAVSRNNSPMTS